MTCERERESERERDEEMVALTSEMGLVAVREIFDHHKTATAIGKQTCNIHTHTHISVPVIRMNTQNENLICKDFLICTTDQYWAATPHFPGPAHSFQAPPSSPSPPGWAELRRGVSLTSYVVGVACNVSQQRVQSWQLHSVSSPGHVTTPRDLIGQSQMGPRYELHH